MSNRLYILLDAFLIEVFPLYSVVFARPYYRDLLLLGLGLAVVCNYVPPSSHVCLPYDMCILGGFLGCFLGFF
jgi:hypothetical protein